jgi:uncharacterized protein
MMTANKNLNRQQQRLLNRYGTWAVVTGASSGMGREIAIKLAEAGFNLVLVARRQNILEQMKADFSVRYGVDIQKICADLGLKTGVETVARQTTDLDVGLLIAAAGFGTSGSFLDADLEAELDMLDVNCRAVVAMSLHFASRFAQQRRGGIVMFSSIVGFQGTPYAAHYAATKAYIQTLAEALYVELAPLGVDVLAAAPGPTRSGFADRAQMQMGAALNPEDLAMPILNALGRSPTILPGFLSKLLVYSLFPLPRWARVQIMGRVMKGMTK